jgi:serpin B
MSIRIQLTSRLLVAFAATSLLSVLPVQAALPFADSSARMGCILYQSLAERSGSDNLAIAPTNLCEALAMLTAGAQGISKNQLEGLLAAGFPAALLADEAQRLRLSLTCAGPNCGPRLRVANGLFCQKEWHPQEAFCRTLETYYEARPQSVDFVQDPVGALQVINGWISQATEQQIPQLLSPGSLDIETRLVLASTLYFQGEWMVPFEAASTRARAFYGADGLVAQIPTMELTAHIRAGQAPGLATLVLPYRGSHGRTCMLIVVPTGNTSLAELERQLTPQWLRSLLQKTQLERTHLYLPRFELNSRNSLLSSLEELGLTALRGRQANFRGIHEDNSLQVSGVEHQVVVHVDEKGTEVAAATSIGMRCTAHQESRIMRVNRPFLFALIEEQTEAVLVIGRLCKPVAH